MKDVCLHQIHSWNTTFLEKWVFLHFKLKTAFCKDFTISRWKMRFASNPLMKYSCFLKSVFCFFLGWKQRFTSFLPFLAEKCVLHQIHSWKTTFSSKVSSQFWVENSVLPSFHHFLLKNTFYIESTHAVQLFLKKCVLLYFRLKTALYQFFIISFWKMRFASNTLMEYLSFLKSVFFSI